MVTHYKAWASACIDLHCCLGFYYSPKLVVADLVEVEYNISDERREKPWFYWGYIEFIEMVDWLIGKSMVQ